jgi:hypothetical protein
MMQLVDDADGGASCRGKMGRNLVVGPTTKTSYCKYDTPTYVDFIQDEYLTDSLLSLNRYLESDSHTVLIIL